VLAGEELGHGREDHHAVAGVRLGGEMIAQVFGGFGPGDQR